MWYIIYINKTILLIAKFSAVHPGSEAEVDIAAASLMGRRQGTQGTLGRRKEGL